MRRLEFAGRLSYRRRRRSNGAYWAACWTWTGRTTLSMGRSVCLTSRLASSGDVGEPATNRRKLFAHDQVQRRVQLIAASNKPCPEVEVRALVNFSRSQSSSTVEGGRVFPVVRFQVKRPDTFLTRFEIINFINFHFYLLPTPDRPSSPCSDLVRLYVRLLTRQDRPSDTRPSSQRPTCTIPTKDNGKKGPNDSGPDITGLIVCPRPASPPPCCQRMVVFVLRSFPTVLALFSY